MIHLRDLTVKNFMSVAIPRRVLTLTAQTLPWCWARTWTWAVMVPAMAQARPPSSMR